MKLFFVSLVATTSALRLRSKRNSNALNDTEGQPISKKSKGELPSNRCQVSEIPEARWTKICEQFHEQLKDLDLVGKMKGKNMDKVPVYAHATAGARCEKTGMPTDANTEKSKKLHPKLMECLSDYLKPEIDGAWRADVKEVSILTDEEEAEYAVKTVQTILGIRNGWLKTVQTFLGIRNGVAIAEMGGKSLQVAASEGGEVHSDALLPNFGNDALRKQLKKLASKGKYCLEYKELDFDKCLQEVKVLLSNYTFSDTKQNQSVGSFREKMTYYFYGTFFWTLTSQKISTTSSYEPKYLMSELLQKGQINCTYNEGEKMKPEKKELTDKILKDDEYGRDACSQTAWMAVFIERMNLFFLQTGKDQGCSGNKRQGTFVDLGLGEGEAER